MLYRPLLVHFFTRMLLTIEDNKTLKVAQTFLMIKLLPSHMTSSCPSPFHLTVNVCCDGDLVKVDMVSTGTLFNVFQLAAE